MGEHTPGPWTPHSLDWRAVEDANGEVVADVRSSPDDARLISAAPDLLAALEALATAKSGDESQIRGEWGLPTDPGYGEDSPELVAARAAIAKATGTETTVES